jgi:hypothetical protein
MSTMVHLAQKPERKSTFGHTQGVRLICQKTVPALYCTETLAEASDVFPGGIFHAKRREPCRKAASSVVAAMYEVRKAGKYQDFFTSFPASLRQLCWSESQIVFFCRKFPRLLQRRTYGTGTFFLFQEEDGRFAVAHVIVNMSQGLCVIVYPFDRDYVCVPASHHRIVVPIPTVSKR